MNTFKAGDKVYFPMQTTKVCTLVEANSFHYPLEITLTTRVGLEICTTSGRRYESDSVPCIFHATVENQTKLEALFNTKFEDAPKKRVIVCFEVPEPFEPKLHERYWSLNRRGVVGHAILNNDLVDKHIKFKWRTEEEASQALNTLNATFGIPE